MATLVRTRDGKMIAGVCAGIARKYGWDVTLVRIIFVLSCLLPGPQFLIYAILWIVMPMEETPVGYAPVTYPGPTTPTSGI